MGSLCVIQIYPISRFVVGGCLNPSFSPTLHSSKNGPEDKFPRNSCGGGVDGGGGHQAGRMDTSSLDSGHLQNKGCLYLGWALKIVLGQIFTGTLCHQDNGRHFPKSEELWLIKPKPLLCKGEVRIWASGFINYGLCFSTPLGFPMDVVSKANEL